MGTSEPAPGGLRERKKDTTRRALAETALRLARERGYQGFTIADVAAEVGVSRRTFSNYFGDKAECVAAVTEGWLDDVLAGIRTAPADASLVDVLHAGLAAVTHQGFERWGSLQALAEAVPEVQARMLAQDGAIADEVAIEIAARAQLSPDDIRVRLLADFAVTAGREVLRRWVTAGDPADNAQLAGLLAAAFSIVDLDGLTAGRVEPEPN